MLTEGSRFRQRFSHHRVAEPLPEARPVNTGPRFQFVDQNGSSYTASDFPVLTGTPVTGEGTREVALVSTGGSGPVTGPGQQPGLGRPGGADHPGQGHQCGERNLPFGNRPQVVVGAPKLRLTYDGTAPSGVRPTGCSPN